jgi:hypothetical protein
MEDIDFSQPEVYETVGTVEEIHEFGVSDEEAEVQNADGINTDPLQLDAARDLFKSYGSQTISGSLADRFMKLKLEFERLEKDMEGNQDQNLIMEVNNLRKTIMMSSTGKNGVMRYTRIPARSDSVETLITKETPKPESLDYIKSLENRIAKLELIVGMNDCKLNMSIVDYVTILEQEYRILKDENKFKDVLSAIKDYDAMIGLQNDSKVHSDKKITSIYNHVRKVQQMAEIIPFILQRLKSLAEIHQQALLFNQELISVKDTQYIIGVESDQIREGISKLSRSFDENLSQIQKNFDLLHKTFNKMV